MAKQQREEQPQVASLDPREMLQGGLKDDFRGKITEAVYTPWDYDGNIDEPVLGVRLTIQVEDEDEPFVQHWSAGSLESFVPSEDGKNACEEGEAGPYALRVGKRAQLNNNTNYAHLMNSIIDSGEASKKFGSKDLTASLECLAGLDAHWNRVPQKKRSGIQAEAPAEGDGGGKRRANDVLVVTEVYGYREAEAKSSKGKAATSSKPNGQAGKVQSKPSPKEDEDEGGIDDDLQAVVIEAIGDSGGKIKKGKLAGEVLKRMAKDPRKAAMVKRSTEAEFVGGGPWEYDEDTGILSLG